MTEPIPSTNPGSSLAPSPKSPAAPQPISLRSFLTSDKPSTAAYLGLCRKAAPPALSTMEAEELIKMLPAQPRSLARLRSLLAELDDPASVVAKQVTDLAESLVRSLLPADVSLPPLKPGLPPGAVKTALRTLVASATKRDLRKRHLTLVMLVWWIVRLRGVVAHEELVEIALREFAPKRKGGRRTPSPSADSIWEEVTRELSPLLPKPAPRSSLLQAVALFGPALKADEMAREAEVARGLELHRKISELEARITALVGEVAARDATLAENERTIAALKADLADQQAVGRQSKRALKTRMIGFLSNELTQSIRDAYDAANTNPVRTHVIFDRLESALNALNREMQWLESSD